jgi:hypothetical protein
MKVTINCNGVEHCIDGALLVCAMDQIVDNDCGSDSMLEDCYVLRCWLLENGCDRENDQGW